MHPEALHEPEGTGNGAIGHDPHDHVHAFRRQADKVPEVVVGSLSLGEGPVGLLLGGVDQVREFDGILDEEDRDIVTDEVPVPLLGIELHSKSAHIARQIGRPLVAGNG